MTAKYRKRPVIVEAEVYKPGMEDGFECINNDKFNGAVAHPECGAWCDKNNHGQGCIYRKPFIDTLEGKHFISTSDYIITGIKGERYPCKPTIFEATYELVEEE